MSFLFFPLQMMVSPLKRPSVSSVAGLSDATGNECLAVSPESPLTRWRAQALTRVVIAGRLVHNELVRAVWDKSINYSPALTMMQARSPLLLAEDRGRRLVDLLGRRWVAGHGWMWYNFGSDLVLVGAEARAIDGFALLVGVLERAKDDADDDLKFAQVAP